MCLERLGPLDDLDRAIAPHVVERLDRPGRYWPGDREGLDGRGFAEADRDDEAVAAEARASADRTINRLGDASRAGDLGPDLRPDRGAVRLGADELDLKPVVLK